MLDADHIGPCTNVRPDETFNIASNADQLSRLRNNQDLNKGGVKYDRGKLRYDLIPVTPLTAVTEVLTYGANKYKDRNWETGMPWGRAYAAAQRHLNSFWGGEELDPETGISHLAHAIVNLMFIEEWRKTHPELDDRSTTLQ